MVEGNLSTGANQVSGSCTSVSFPSLFVKAASLKQIIHTAFSFTTLSARGTRLRMGPKGCIGKWEEWQVGVAELIQAGM